LIQEHWLYLDDLYKLDRTNDDFVSTATSAMQIKTACGPRKGRPFGGVGVLLHNSIAASAKCVAKEDRFIASFVGDVLIVKVYLPFDTNDSCYEEALHDIIQKIEKVIVSNGTMNVLIGGDFNFGFTCVSTL